MRYLLSLITFILLTSISHSQIPMLLLMDDGIAPGQVLAEAYQTRVEADGGIVITKASVISAYKTILNNSLTDSIYLWCEMDFGVKKNITDSVSVVYDLMGNDLTQNDSMAVWYADSVNGLPSLYFDATGAAYKQYDIPLFAVAPTRLSVFLVVKLKADPSASAPTTGLWRITSNTANATHFPYTDGTIYNDFGSDTRQSSTNPATSMATDFVIYEVRSASGEWTDWLNGTQLSTTETNTVGLDSPVIFGKSNQDFHFYGQIAAIIITSTFDHSAVRTYLTTKYGL